MGVFELMIQWIAVDGSVTQLDDEVNYFVTRGRAGQWMPPFGLVETAVPDEAGSRLDNVRTKPRDLDLPFVIVDTGYEAVITRIRALAKKFLCTEGQGKLRVTRADLTQREITAAYGGGLDTAKVTAGTLKTVLAFHAPDPYWMATSAVINTYTKGIASIFFPFFPLVLTNSDIFSDATIDNPGDVEAWPVWRINGPGSDPGLANLTTGKTLTLTVTLAAGDYVEIDTRPGYKTVKLNGETNLFGSLGGTSSLWSLLAGLNSIRIELNDATDASSVVLSYYPRYLSE
jgi:hypothetical protein